jgi:hypothetical protein
METKKTAEEICDKIGLTNENERFWFIQGYNRGVVDTKYEAIKDVLEVMSRPTMSIPHETR